MDNYGQSRIEEHNAALALVLNFCSGIPDKHNLSLSCLETGGGPSF